MIMNIKLISNSVKFLSNSSQIHVQFISNSFQNIILIYILVKTFKLCAKIEKYNRIIFIFVYVCKIIDLCIIKVLTSRFIFCFFFISIINWETVGFYPQAHG